MQPVHQNDHMQSTQSGRGAGGHCFIKDFAAFRELYEKTLSKDAEGVALLRAFELKNNKLLRRSRKDLELLDGVYGKVTKTYV
jgi:UDP-glucose 6-dehydrogenase